MAASWGGQMWSHWIPIEEAADAIDASEVGLYRIRGGGGDALVYVGEGRLRSRLTAHKTKVADPRSRQGRER